MGTAPSQPRSWALPWERWEPSQRCPTHPFSLPSTILNLFPPQFSFASLDTQEAELLQLNEIANEVILHFIFSLGPILGRSYCIIDISSCLTARIYRIGSSWASLRSGPLCLISLEWFIPFYDYCRKKLWKSLNTRWILRPEYIFKDLSIYFISSELIW